MLKRQDGIDKLEIAHKPVTVVENNLRIGDLPLALGMNDIAEIPPPLPLSVLPERREAMQTRLAAIDWFATLYRYHLVGGYETRTTQSFGLSGN